MTNIGWHFKERTRSDEVADPIQEEFFQDDSKSGDFNPARSLVRESIQNSVDACDNHDSSVVVQFRVVLPKESNKKVFDRWFDDLWLHLQSDRNGLNNLPNAHSECGYIVIEDFGTTGLEGDPERGKLPDPNDEDDIFAFFRSSALSGKKGKAGGRWGVGKSVFNRASHINAFLAYTVRDSDSRSFMFGRCFLKTHKVGIIEYQPYGRFGDADDDEFVHVVDDPAGVDQLQKDFGLLRDRNSPGLSIIVPFYDDRITATAILSAVVEEYFYPIIADKLMVSVSGQELPHKSVRLNADSIWDYLQSSANEGLLGIAGFAKWICDTPESEIKRKQLLSPTSGEPPVWGESLPLPESIPINDIAKQFNNGDPLAFRVPLWVQKDEQNPTRTFFDVYLQKDLDGKGYRPVFIRNGIIIPRALERRVRGHSLYGIIMVENEPIASLLGDSETPAHTEWSAETANFKNKYQFGSKVLEFVRTAPRAIVEFLSQAQDERDYFALADYFPAQVSPDGRIVPGKRRKKPKKKTTDTEIPPIPRKKQPYRIDKINSGFRIVRDNQSETDLPNLLDIRVAYDTQNGDPLKKYNPVDFNFAYKNADENAIQIECLYVDIIEAKDNHLRVGLLKDNFEIEVTGFDTNRDVIVNCRRKSLPSSESEKNKEEDEVLVI